MIFDQILYVDENSPLQTTVETVIVTAPDASETLTYTITSGNTGSVFAINSSTGEISVAEDLNYETTNQYDQVVIVTDNAATPLSASAAITIYVNDEGDAPTEISLSEASIDENDYAYCSLTSGTGDTDNSSFTIVNENELKIKPRPDFETKSSYSIRVLVTEDYDMTFEKVVIISINDVNLWSSCDTFTKRQSNRVYQVLA